MIDVGSSIGALQWLKVLTSTLWWTFHKWTPANLDEGVSRPFEATGICYCFFHLSLLLGGAHCGLPLLANTPESGYSSSCYSRPLFKAAAQFFSSLEHCTTHVSVALIQPYLVFPLAFPCFDLSSPFVHRFPGHVLNSFPSISRMWVSLQSWLEWRGM